MLNINSIKSSIPNALSEKHFERLKKHNIHTFWMMIGLSTLLAFTLWKADTSPKYILIWVSILLFSALARLTLNIFQKAESSEKSHSKWIGQYLIMTTLLSTIWGITGVLFFPTNPLLQSTQLLILITVLISTSPLLLASRSVFFIQFAVLITPISFSVFQQFSRIEYIFMSLALLALITILLITGRYIHAVIVELRESQTALRSQADTDQLTKLANRRSFDRAFKAEWRRSTREQSPVSLLIMDVDDFKGYNDSYGHQAGDNALKRIASQVRTAARRPGDISARIGGEEFAILLPDTSIEGAMILAERLRSSIERLRMEHSKNTAQPALTVSIGVSSCQPTQGSSNDNSTDIIYPAMLMKSADHAMYRAKGKGKNRVIQEGCGTHCEPIALKKSSVA